MHPPAPSHEREQLPALGQSPIGSVPDGANCVVQPVAVQRLTVQGATGGRQPVPPEQLPPVHVEPVVHASPSSHSIPSFAVAKPHPVLELQVLA